jgi:hypothetical protein
MTLHVELGFFMLTFLFLVNTVTVRLSNLLHLEVLSPNIVDMLLGAAHDFRSLILVQIYNCF